MLIGTLALGWAVAGSSVAAAREIPTGAYANVQAARPIGRRAVTVAPVRTSGAPSGSPRPSDGFALTTFYGGSRRGNGAVETPNFIKPLDGEVTSGFGSRYGGLHTGLDIDGETGDPVIASASGRIVHTDEYFGYGTTVIIDHGDGFATLYGHLSATDVKLGRVVPQGGSIGSVGCTGECTGDHLHFEIRIDDEPVDPVPYLPGGRLAAPSPPVMPVPSGSLR